MVRWGTAGYGEVRLGKGPGPGGVWQGMVGRGKGASGHN